MDIAKLFQNGSNQAVHLPEEFQFRGDCVYIKKMGDAVILMPYRNTWALLESSLSMFADDFMVDRQQPELEQRLA